MKIILIQIIQKLINNYLKKNKKYLQKTTKIKIMNINKYSNNKQINQSNKHNKRNIQTNLNC